MEIPRVSRPYMPGYGIAGPAEGSGLLHWSWAAERLTAARTVDVRGRARRGEVAAKPIYKREE